MAIVNLSFLATAFTLTAMGVNVNLISTLAYISQCKGISHPDMESLMLMSILLQILYYLYKISNKI